MTTDINRLGVSKQTLPQGGTEAHRCTKDSLLECHKH